MWKYPFRCGPVFGSKNVCLMNVTQVWSLLRFDHSRLPSPETLNHKSTLTFVLAETLNTTEIGIVWPERAHPDVCVRTRISTPIFEITNQTARKPLRNVIIIMYSDVRCVSSILRHLNAPVVSFSRQQMYRNVLRRPLWDALFELLALPPAIHYLDWNSKRTNSLKTVAGQCPFRSPHSVTSRRAQGSWHEIKLLIYRPV